MDLGHLALRGPYALILAPYSLITYLRSDAEVDRCIAGLHALLEPSGALLLDAFIPAPVHSFAEFRQDYRRPHGAGWLERHKRITVLADGCNRIERRYHVQYADGRVLETIETAETIRPYRPAELQQILERHGFRVATPVYDYGATTDAAGARFCSLLGRR
jgi:hypothetical protein